ncbi:MAG: AAA family ATPase [Candidatus Saccharimonadales bacterium]
MNIKVEIENGYGISSLSHEFNFGQESNFYALYAQNGTMKSSFAKALDDHSKGIPIKDHLFNVEGKCSVSGIDSQNILSFPCFDGRVELTDEAALLVSNEAAKEAYSKAFDSVNVAYKKFTAKLAEVAGHPLDESSVSELVGNMHHSFVKDSAEPVTSLKIIQLLRGSLPEVSKGDTLFCDVSYKRYTHTNFAKFIGNKKYLGFFEKLASAYDEFVASPTYYRAGFDASSATKLTKALKDSRYFNAKHSVTLTDGDGKPSAPVQDLGKLDELLKTDFDIILEKYPALKSALTSLINDFAVGTNGDVRSIFEDPSKRRLLLFMGSEDRFYRNMWYGYLAGCIDEVNNLLQAHDTASEEIKQALERARDSDNEWEEVVEVFNDRFRNLPYRIDISNKQDAIVDELVKPVFEVKFMNPRNPNDPYREKPDVNGKLSGLGLVLSNGERKALYLLNVIFKLRNQVKKGCDTLVVFDDIVESFDYKNKYAFFEYLQDISSDTNKLYVIVLTHNFDFYRLVYEKIHPRKDDQFKIASRSRDGSLSIHDMFNIRVFGEIKKRAAFDESAWVGLIPLARNIIEYSKSVSDDDYLKLTKCLHVMPDQFNVGDIMQIIGDNTGVLDSAFSATTMVHDAIISAANNIVSEEDDGFDLHKSLALAIAVRIQIEKYIIGHITDDDYQRVVRAGRDQTRGLMKTYKNHTRDANKTTILVLFNKATMMIDGSIHINSFMYEPLIDMGTWELKELYSAIVQVTAPPVRT